MKLEISKRAQKELDQLTDSLVLRVAEKLTALGKNPYQGSQKLAGGKAYRIRIGDYRVVYTIDKKAQTIVIIKIGHRREVYR